MNPQTASRKRVRTAFTRSVEIGNVEKHKAQMEKRGWLFDKTEPIGNGCETHVWVYYRKQAI